MDEGESVPSDKILVALEELSKWQEKQGVLEEELRNAPEGLRDLKRQELDMAKRHVRYYRALAKDMKKATRPSRVGQFINSVVIF